MSFTSLETQGNGTVSKPFDAPLYACGIEISLIAIADFGWEFTGWTGDLTGNNPSQSVTMTDTKSVTATFAIVDYDIVTDIIGMGSVNTDGSPPYHYGDVITMTAIPFSGWNFTGWQGSIVSNVPTKYTALFHRMLAQPSGEMTE